MNSFFLISCTSRKKALGNKDDPTTWAQYQRHRLPLQQGSVVLDKDYEPDSSMLAVFIRRWEFCASSQDHEALSVAMYGSPGLIMQRRQESANK